MTPLHTQLRAAIKGSGYSQAEVARRAGISPQRLSDLLRGLANGHETITRIEAVAKVVGKRLTLA